MGSITCIGQIELKLPGNGFAGLLKRKSPATKSSGRWLSPTIHKFGDEFIHSGLSAIRQAHRPEFIEGLSEYGKAFH